MALLYEEVCAELKWPVDKALLAKMQSKNQEKLEKLDETLKDTEENLGETEVRDALYDKAEYLCKIGDKVMFEEKKYFNIHYIILHIHNLLFASQKLCIGIICAQGLVLTKHSS